MIDPEMAHSAAHAIARAALGRDPGPLDGVDSRSHHVFVGATVVVKLIDSADHSRLDREIALAVELPVGLSAPVLASGRYPAPSGDLRYACVARLPGTAPGMGLPGVDRAAACRWAGRAIEQLQRLHSWRPSEPVATILRERLDHGGFVGRARLRQAVDDLRARDTDALVPRSILDGVAAIADRAPEQAQVCVPVHADCHWSNWLVRDDPVHGDDVTLLDFEWARFGEPADDWMFLAGFSGPHRQAVLGLIAEATGTPPDQLRAACEVREAAHLSADLLLALGDYYRHERVRQDQAQQDQAQQDQAQQDQAQQDQAQQDQAQQDRAQQDRAQHVVGRFVSELDALVVGRSWWQPER